MLENEKIIIFDSGTIINFAMNGLTGLLAELKKIFKGRFLITEEVKYEIIDKPKRINKFKLEAMMIEKLFDEKVIELPYQIIGKNELKNKMDKIFDILNHTFYARDEFMNIVDKAEVGVLALSLLLNEKGIKNVVAIDERTARMLCEMPDNLEKLFQEKLKTPVEMKHDISFLSQVKVIRSSELMYIAYKKGLVKLKDHVLEALLYAVKFKGCSISFEEINKIKNL